MNVRKYKNIGMILFCLCFLMVFYFKLKSAELIIDDLDFLKKGGDDLRRITSFSFHYGNGRLLGNILGALYAKHRMLYSISGAGMMLSIIILPIYIFDISPRYIPVIGMFLILCNECFWSELYLWSSAFANYIPPIITLELCIIIFKLLSEKKCEFYIGIILLILLGFTGQLYVEHMTVIAIISSVAICVWGYKTKIFKIYRIVYLISTVLGGMFMVSIPRVFSHNDVQKNYRTVIMSDMNSNMDEMILNIYEKLFIIILCILVMSLIMFCIYSRNKDRIVRSKTGILKKIIIYTIIIIALGVLLACGYTRTLLMVVYFVIIVVSCVSIIHVDDRGRRLSMYILFGLANVVLLCSLPVALPGARLIYISYYCMVILFVMYLQYIVENITVKKNGFTNEKKF